MSGITAPAGADASITDEQLIEDAIAVIGDARSRAPADYLTALSVILAVAAVVLLGAGALTSGALQDLLLNLGSEVIGIGITVILIDGLWKRRETATSATLSDLTTRLRTQRGVGLGRDERDAWRAFVDDYRRATARETLVDRARALTTYGRRVMDLRRRAERILADPGAGAPDAGSTR